MFYKTAAPGYIGHNEAGFKEMAALSKELGYEGYWFDAGKDFTGDPQEVKDLLKKYELIPAGFGVPVEFRKDEETFRKDIEALPPILDFAKEIGANRCITWIIPSSDEYTYEENFALHAKRLKVVAEMLEERGIAFGLEFVGPMTARKSGKYEFIYNLDGMMKLIDAIGTGNLGILMDAWHWDLAGQTFDDFKKFTSKEQIVCVHINDAPANIPMEEQQDLIRRLPGTTGIIRIEEFFAGLENTGYDGPVIVEPFEAFLAKVPVERAMKIAKKAMDQVWPE